MEQFNFVVASAINFIDYEDVETDPNVSPVQNVVKEIENQKFVVENFRRHIYRIIEH